MVMKAKYTLFALVSVALIGCGGGSGNTTNSSASTPNNPIVTYSTFSMSGKLTPWFASALPNIDGSEYLIMSSLDEPNPFSLTPPTPVYILKPNENNGSVSDITANYFNNQPNYFWVRNITAFIHPESGTQAIWFCNSGREVGDPYNVPIPRQPGIWGEQDGLFVMENGKFIDKSHTLPQIIDYSHGCSSLYNNTGKISLVKNTLGHYGYDHPDSTILNYDKSKDKWVPIFASSYNNPGPLKRNVNYFYATAINSVKEKMGTHVIFGSTVLKQNNISFDYHSHIQPLDLEADGYDHVQGGISGDYNNDGLEDLILIYSIGFNKSKPALSGAKLALFKNDGKGNLIYDPSALLDSYGETEFSLDIKIMDINFDGHPDIVSFGKRYLYGTNTPYQKISKAFINNGYGKFNLKTIELSTSNPGCINSCQMGFWFLKGKDNSSFNIISYSRSGDLKTFYSQTITSKNPLILK